MTASVEYWVRESRRRGYHQTVVHRGDYLASGQGARVTISSARWHGPYPSATAARAAAREFDQMAEDCRTCAPGVTRP